MTDFAKIRGIFIRLETLQHKFQKVIGAQFAISIDRELVNENDCHAMVKPILLAYLEQRIAEELEELCGLGVIVTEPPGEKMPVKPPAAKYPLRLRRGREEDDGA